MNQYIIRNGRIVYKVPESEVPEVDWVGTRTIPEFETELCNATPENCAKYGLEYMGDKNFKENTLQEFFENGKRQQTICK